MKRRRRRRHVAAVLSAGAVLALALTACGGGSGGSDSSTTAASGGPGGFDLTDDQRACIEEKGVSLPEGGGQPSQGAGPPDALPNGQGPGGQDLEKLQQALKDCGVETPNPPQGGFDPKAMRAQISDYVACVRKNGFDLPKPNTQGDGPVFDSSQVDQNDPKFQAASAKCQDLLPQGGPPQG
jgi:hypothetical protein